jgi:hypothetical protein
MITREEYNKALDTVEAYHNQLFTGKINGSLMDLTPPLKWDKFKHCSTRLQTVLKTAHSYNTEYKCEYFIESMDWIEFKKIRNAGRKTWSEFIELRG